MTTAIGPFKVLYRTECSCRECQAPCHVMPGMLIPADVPRIMAVADLDEHQFATKFRASPGAVVGTTDGKRWRIGTIVPARRDDGKGPCVFYERGRCTIHPVAPFGCSFVDMHMTVADGDRVVKTGLSLIAHDPAYEALRLTLRPAPSPEQGREELKKLLDDMEAVGSQTDSER